jgi:hypothetical protein
MHAGRLIRVSKFRGELNSTLYVVAIAAPSQAIAAIRAQAATPDHEVDDLGGVSGALLESMNLLSGKFKRV